MILLHPKFEQVLQAFGSNVFKPSGIRAFQPFCSVRKGENLTQCLNIIFDSGADNYFVYCYMNKVRCFVGILCTF